MCATAMRCKTDACTDLAGQSQRACCLRLPVACSWLSAGRMCDRGAWTFLPPAGCRQRRFRPRDTELEPCFRCLTLRKLVTGHTIETVHLQRENQAVSMKMLVQGRPAYRNAVQHGSLSRRIGEGHATRGEADADVMRRRRCLVGGRRQRHACNVRARSTARCSINCLRVQLARRPVAAGRPGRPAKRSPGSWRRLAARGGPSGPGSCA